MMGLATPWKAVLPLADGTIEAFDRAQFVYCYPGLTAVTPTPTPTRSFGGGGSVGRKYRRGYERRKKLEELRKQFEEALREADKRAEEARKELEEARREAQEATARAKEAQEQADEIVRTAKNAEDRYRAALAEIHAETLAELAREERERLAEIARREAEELEAAIEAARVKADLLCQFLEEAGGELEADAQIEAEFSLLLEWEKRRKARVRRRKRQRRMERMLRRPEERLLMSDAPLEEIEAKLIAWSELIASV